MSTPTTLKIVMVGVGSVGKSSLVLRFVYDEFPERYDPTKADSYKKTHLIDGITYTLEILDTAGQEAFSAIRDNYYKHAQGFLLVYDVTSTKTFNETEQIYQHIERVRESKNFPCILVGNKSDLENEIEDKDLEELLRDMKVTHQLTSAKQNNNVSNVFEQISKLIIAANVAPVKAKKPDQGCKCVIL
eukprot:NODE_184_length_13742_cov_0.550539.p8 type:complete len:188 gc:universal NODE_184_length_13742_cov_0.550539:3547-2984(-)